MNELVERVNKLLLAGEPGNITKQDTNGYVGYEPQSLIDAMNEGFGLGNWGFEELSSETVDNEKGTLAVAQVRVWLKDIDFKPFSWGQSRVTRGDIGDAKKGAQTDALKKALSYFSIGNRAYHGLLDKKSPPTVQKPPKQDQALHALAKPGSYEQHEANGHHDLPTLRELQARCNRVIGSGMWQTMLHKALKIEDDELVLQEDDLTPGDREHAAAYMDYVEQARAKKASAGAGK